MSKAFYRRKLPHLQRDGKFHFVTFCTYGRWLLPESARAIALDCCLHDNDTKILMQAAVVMPDHVHIIFSPLVNATEVYSLAEILGAIKGASAHKINQLLSRTGKVWQTESFDNVLLFGKPRSENFLRFGESRPSRSGFDSGELSIVMATA